MSWTMNWREFVEDIYKPTPRIEPQNKHLKQKRNDYATDTLRTPS